MRIDSFAPAALLLLAGGCALEAPDETVPLVLVGAPAAGATIPSGEAIRVVAAARDDGGNLVALRAEIGTCVEEAVASTNAEIVVLDRVSSCRPTGEVTVHAWAVDEAGWIGRHAVVVVVEP